MNTPTPRLIAWAEPKTTKTLTLPDKHWGILEFEANRKGMPVDDLVAHAVRLMQDEAINTRRGLSMVWIGAAGVVR